MSDRLVAEAAAYSHTRRWRFISLPGLELTTSSPAAAAPPPESARTAVSVII